MNYSEASQDCGLGNPSSFDMAEDTLQALQLPVPPQLMPAISYHITDEIVPGWT